MAIIRNDEEGPYAYVGGWIARPRGFQTMFETGTKVSAKHFGGTSNIGMGKIEGRGKYSEYWQTSGLAPHMKG